MKKIWMVNGTTGLVEGTGLVADDADMTPHIRPGSLLVEIPPSNDMQIWQNGAWVDRPTRPSDNHLWVDGAWQLNEQAAAAMFRRQRDVLLAKSDWTQLPDVPVAAKEAWATYRQQLRDITTQSGYPATVVWPTPPQ